jgi:hypothetical protein
MLYKELKTIRDMIFFKRRVTEQLSFHTGADGMGKHRQFISDVDKKRIKIINTWTTYHSYDSSHEPEYLNYVITYKK